MTTTTTFKRIASFLFVFVLCAGLFLSPAKAFATSGKYVFDDQGLFTSSEFSTLEAQAEEISEKYNMGVYIWTTDIMNETYKSDSEEEATRKQVVESYYRGNGLGFGTNHDGIILAIASVSREYNLGALGQGSYSFNDKGIAEIKEDVKEELSSNDWYGAAKVYLSDVDKQLAYYDEKGKTYTPFTLGDLLIRIALILGVPLIITFFVINGWRSAMKTAVEQSEASNYLDPNSVQLTKAHDQFVHTTHIVTPRPKESKSGGGGWGGGGGGGFSSSGGRF